MQSYTESKTKSQTKQKTEYLKLMSLTRGARVGLPKGPGKRGDVAAM